MPPDFVRLICLKIHRMKRCLLFLLLATSPACLFSQSLKRSAVAAPVGFDYQPNEVKILSWNVEHFIDQNDNPYINNGREDSGDRMEGKEALLMKAIKAVDADVVVLQEFESVQYLARLVREHLPDMGYRFFADAESYSWYMNVVVMSKVPLGTIYSYGALYTAVPGILTDEGVEETQININTRMLSIDVFPNADYEFTLTGVHLKAGRGERNEQMRLGQINFLKTQFARFIKEDKKANLVMVGDFNCMPDSKEFQALMEGKKRLQFVDPLAGTEVYSHPSREPARRIDHIIANRNMMKELVPGSLKIEDVLSREEMIKLSDHMPVVAVFKAGDQ